MRFSIQEQNEKKMFFHVPSAAQKATGLNLTTIKTILERGGNPKYHRKSDNKLFVIQKEDPIKILTIEGEDFFSLEDIQTKFELSPTKFLNQVKNGKFAKRIGWISAELSSPENEDEDEKIDEMESLRTEMNSQFEKFRAEIDRLSSRVEKLENEKVELEQELKELKSIPPPKVAEVSPATQEEKPATPEKDPPKQYPIREKPIFKATKVLDRSTFKVRTMANFIRYGIVGKIIICTPKNQKYVLLNERREYLPDLVEEIIATHIHPEMGEGNEEKTKEFSERMKTDLDNLDKKAFAAVTKSSIMMRRIRALDPETIQDITKELMKII